MFKKHLVFVLLAGILAVSLAPMDAAAKMKVNMASSYGPGAPVHFGLEKFKELVEKRSNGEMEVLIHLLGTMGGERDIFEALSQGAVETAAMGSGDIAIFHPQYLCYEVPYVIRDVKHFWNFWNGPVGKEINDVILTKNNVICAAIVYRGARQLTANKPIRKPEDVKGIKLRLPEVKPWVEIWKALGARPTVVPFQEVYMALKTGVAEAQENPAESIHSLKFYENQKYLIMTEHVHSTAKYEISKKWFDTLKPAQQEMIMTAMKEAAEYANKLSMEADKKFIEDLQKKGMTQIVPDKAAFVDAVKPTVQRLAKEMWVPGLYEKVIAIK
jgi:tripartite ATP-independent transporter DctP family solute receptor